MKLRAVSPAVGAEVWDVSLGRLSNSEMVDLRAAFAAHGVLVFRDQDLSPEDHLRFARQWGEIVINPFLQPLDGYPEIAELRKEPDQQRNIGATWHTDTSYQQAPALGSILAAREVPPVGGDTLFAGMAAAYEALSDGLKQTLRTLRAIHSSVESFGAEFEEDQQSGEARFINPQNATHTVSHPLVIAHPESGRSCLYANPDFTTRIDGWTKEESASLLDMLYAHATRPEFTCRLRWEAGSVAFWDNRATLHCALNDYQGHRRVMHRITLAGQALG